MEKAWLSAPSMGRVELEDVSIQGPEIFGTLADRPGIRAMLSRMFNEPPTRFRLPEKWTLTLDGGFGDEYSALGFAKIENPSTLNIVIHISEGCWEDVMK